MWAARPVRYDAPRAAVSTSTADASQTTPKSICLPLPCFVRLLIPDNYLLHNFTP